MNVSLRSQKLKKDREAVFKEHTDKSYGAGASLTGETTGVQNEGIAIKKCKCGSTNHQQTTHKECPLQKGNTVGNKNKYYSNMS
jgi:hypothetical protein